MPCKCLICGNDYSLLGGLVNHVQRTHKIDYKIYYDTYVAPGRTHVCIYCGKQNEFSHGVYKETCGSESCVRKLQHDTMRKLYGKSMASKDAETRRHIKKYGSIEKYEDYVRHSAEMNKFTCSICGKGYKSLNKLSQHLSEVHPEVDHLTYFEKYIDKTDHSCPYCGNKRKFESFKFQMTCGSSECLCKLHSDNNAMNVQENRDKVSSGLRNINNEDKIKIRKRIRNTCIARFGYPHNWSSPDMRDRGQYATCEKKYGDRYYHNIQKMQSTNMERFGVKSYSQTIEFNSRKWHKVKFDGLTFDSLYEVKFYNILKYLGISFEYHPKIKFQYFFNGKQHFYFPDFLIGTRIIDIKNSYLLHLMSIPETKENSKLLCIKENNVELVDGELCETLINFIAKINVTADVIVDHCIGSPFPGTHKWPAAHPIWRSFVPGYKSPYAAWKDKATLRNAVNNMLKILNYSLETGKYRAFCVHHIFELIKFARGEKSDIDKLVLARFTIAKIAPKVTALRSLDLLKIIEQSGKDLSNGVYCPMSGFGGIVSGVIEWFTSRGITPDGKIEAYDINPLFCSWYGWTERDVLAGIIHTDKTVIACPPFGKKYEHWEGTPDEMSDIGFTKWVSLIKEHIKAPDYIFIGPEKNDNSGKKSCGLFSKRIGVQLYNPINHG